MFKCEADFNIYRFVSGVVVETQLFERKNNAIIVEEKKKIILSTLEKITPRIVWDLGANTGIFSRLASDQRINTISFDIDPLAVEKNYL